MKTREKRERLLVALYIRAKAKGYDRYLSVLEVADQLGIQRDPGELRLWVKELEQSGMLDVSYTLGGGPDGGMSATLTSRGVEEAEDLLEANPTFDQDANSATGEYLSSRPISEATSEQTSELQAALKSSNAISAEDREIALSEIAVFEAAIAQPVVSSDLVERFIDRVLRWLTSKFAEGAVSAIAAALIVKLLPFLAA